MSVASHKVKVREVWNFTEFKTIDLYALLTGSHPSLLSGCLNEFEDLPELRYD